MVPSCTMASCIGNRSGRSVGALRSETAAAKALTARVQNHELTIAQRESCLSALPASHRTGALPGRSLLCLLRGAPLWLGWWRRGCVRWALHPGRVLEACPPDLRTASGQGGLWVTASLLPKPLQSQGAAQKEASLASNWWWVTLGHHRLKQDPGSALGGQGLGSGCQEERKIQSCEISGAALHI